MPIARPARRAKPVAALERGLSLLRVLAASPEPLSHGEMAARAGISKPTLTRLVGTLADHRMIVNAPQSEKYRLGPGVLPLAQSFLAGLDYRAAARPHLAALADATGGWTYLGVLDGDEIVLVETCRARANVLLSRLDVGSRLGLASSSLGRAYLAACTPAERARLVRTLPVAERPGLERAVAAARRNGYASSIGAWHRDINTVAVAVRGPREEILALNCGGPAFAFPARTLHTLVVPQLQRAAHAIGRAIGGALVHATRRDPP